MKVSADHCGLQRPGPDDHSAETDTYGRSRTFVLVGNIGAPAESF